MWFLKGDIDSSADQGRKRGSWARKRGSRKKGREWRREGKGRRIGVSVLGGKKKD